MRSAFLPVLCCLVLAWPVRADEPIFLASNPALSPDGKLLAFGWAGDVWVAPVTGGAARPLTRHPARDGSPVFSPDGKEIAFVSERTGSPQLFIVALEGGEPRQVTYHTAGFDLQDWFPDGKRLLALGSRDHYWGRNTSRFLAVDAAQRRAEQVLFDDYGANGQLSPDGKKLLYTREGPAWWRKGYRGSQADQVWLFDLAEGTHKKLLHRDTQSRWPLWKPDGSGFYYVGGPGKAQQLYEHRFADGVERPLTQMADDSVVFPCISRDGSTIVFRHRFDLYRLKPGNGAPEKIDLKCTLDRTSEKVNRRVLQSATNVAFNAEGTEIAFIAGGDVWVMDTELKEPRQVTATPEEERDVVFAPDGESLWFASDAGGQCDLRKAVRKDPAKPWFLNEEFPQSKLTDDAETEGDLKFSPAGDKAAFVKGRGDLWIMDADGKNARKLLAGFTRPEFDWAPDSQWLVVAKDDSDFNRDVWIMPLDGSRPPYNLSRNPFPDANPVWSPNGKMIVFVGARGEPSGAAGTRERDIFYVYLTQDEDEQGSRERAIEKSLEKIKKAKLGLPIAEPGAAPAASAPGGDPAAPAGPRRRRPGTDEFLRSDDPKTDEPKKDEPKKDGDAKKEPEKPKKQPPPKVAIDFDKLNERVRRIRIPDSSEGALVWSPDSKKLAFSGSIEGKRGLCTVEFPDQLTPKFVSTATLGDVRWIKTGNLLVGHAAGVPSTLSTAAAASPTGAAPTSYRFSAQQTEDLPAKRRAVFDLAWRTMRDSYYDDQLGKNDWNAIRAKYADMAGQAPDDATLAVVVNMMLGELNGSHLGFSITGGLPRGQTPPDPQAGARWSESTAHLGVRFDPAFAGPGLLIRDVIPGGPADQKKSKLNAGEVILAIDGQPVTPSQDLTAVLNGKLPRDVKLKVKAKDGKERDLTLRPFSYGEARPLLYRKWIEDNRAAVEKLSGGKLGYLHIDAMSMPSFYKFEEELCAQGYGKDGLVIDVRENGGGSTADHLLTALTQPVHAYAVPRGGEPGYPQDRKVYATWNKPIIVLCNQNSFSNAEIFSHAIKTLKRGKVVGVPTAGGVISTGGTAIMDVGFLRQPFRGWHLLNDGEDMELNGCVPDLILWPEPGQMPRGEDKQLEKAVETLLADVKAWQARPQPTLKKASGRENFDK